ncbi:hypothetical protein PsYK624_140640 [Phanerochaete sordida]|uniref:Uncharacterized protein n=1 Tax=Phanerochaete sordida TaxID=48140 RepID=A0A9P3LL21_9APHY|nr:hypothetical protein PsYK624_140640 [Phanerochaete sordida]
MRYGSSRGAYASLLRCPPSLPRWIIFVSLPNKPGRRALVGLSQDPTTIAIVPQDMISSRKDASAPLATRSARWARSTRAAGPLTKHAAPRTPI